MLAAQPSFFLVPPASRSQHSSTSGIKSQQPQRIAILLLALGNQRAAASPSPPSPQPSFFLPLFFLQEPVPQRESKASSQEAQDQELAATANRDSPPRPRQSATSPSPPSPSFVPSSPKSEMTNRQHLLDNRQRLLLLPLLPSFLLPDFLGHRKIWQSSAVGICCSLSPFFWIKFLL